MTRAWAIVALATLLYPVLAISASIWVSLLALFALTASLVAGTNDRSFSLPITVFAPFFCLYAAWFPVSVMAGPGALQLFGPTNWGAITLSLNLSYLGLLTFAIVGLAVGNYRGDREAAPTGRAEGATALLLVSSLIVLGAAGEAVLAGAASKQDVVEGMGLLTRLSTFAGYFIAVGLLLLAIEDAPNWRKFLTRWSAWIACLALAAAISVLGERDMLFRCLAIGAVVYFAKTRNAGLAAILLIAVAAIVAIPVTQQAKSILLSGRIVFDVNEMFLGEFFSAGRNIYHLIDVGVQHSIAFVWSDIQRALSPLFPGAMSTGAWFHDVYRPDNGLVGSGAGWGFGYIPQGYLVGAEIGVIFVMTVVSLIVHGAHRLSSRSIFWFAFYVLTLSTAIYCIRADIANLLSQTFKIGGLTVIVYYAADISMKTWHRMRAPAH